MTPVPTGLELRPVVIPASVDAPEAADFIEMTRVRNAVHQEISGRDDARLGPAELLPAYAPAPDEIRLVWAPVIDGRFAGRVGVDIPLESGSRVAFVRIEVLRAFAGRGIGRAAQELIERVAREHGRTVLQAWAEHPHTDGPHLAPPGGAGSIPHDRTARFARRNGYALEQVERISVLDLRSAASHIDERYAAARESARDYRAIGWTFPTPREFVSDYAWMKSRMSTDAPAAGLEFDEERWDTERIARHERMSLDAGRTLLVTAAQHIATGRLVAFTELAIGADRTAATQQEDTLVLSEHRGHRLGMLIKCAALVAWRQIAPDSPRVLTVNAEENRPMLDINEALGFTPLVYQGAWKKVLHD